MYYPKGFPAHFRTNGRSFVCNLLIALLLLPMSFFALLSSYIALAQGDIKDITITYFYENLCASCDPEGEFIELYNEQVGSEKEGVEVEILFFNLFKETGRQRAEKYYEEYDVPGEKRHAPIVFIGNRYLAGSEEIEKNLRDAFIAAKEEAEAQKADDLGYEPQIRETEKVPEPDVERIIREDSLAVYFHVTACGECEDVEDYFNTLEDRYPLDASDGSKNTDFKLLKFNIGETENLELLNKYFEAYKVQEDDQSVPIVFIGDTYLAGEENIKEGLVEQIRRGSGLTTPDLRSGIQLDSTETLDLSGYQILGVFATGLINGLNPCSVSMLLFFLSMLLVKNINVLKIGLTFIAGKFITYVLLGTLFFNLFAKLDIPWFQTFIKAAMLVIVLILIIFNLSDFIAARKEEYGKIRLQLPESFRKYNHQWIKKFTAEGNGRWLIIASFGLGALISVGEFLCTGQIYLATIIYVLQESQIFSIRALIYFLIYGIAFVTPLLLLTLLIYKGREVFELSELFRRKMHIIKLINAIVFLIFGIAVLIWF